MSVLAMDSFALYNGAPDMPLRGWDVSVANNIAILPAGGLEGQPAVQFTPDGTTYIDGSNTYHYGDIRFDFSPITNGTIIGGILFRVDALPSSGLMGMFTLEGTLTSYTHVYARINYEGNLYLQTPGNLSTDAFPITIGQWYHMEVKAFIDNPGTAEIRIDSIPIGDLSGDIEDTDTTVDAIRIGPTDENSYNYVGDGQFSVSDFYCLNTADAEPNDFLGDAARVERVDITGEGSTIQFYPTTGSDNSAMIDDDPAQDYDTTRNNERTAGKKDTFDVGNLTYPSNGRIYAIKASVVAKKGDTTSRTINIVQRHNSVEADSSALTLAEDYESHSAIFSTNPDTSLEWTKNEFATAQFGYKIAT